jgi:hypothetical protein
MEDLGSMLLRDGPVVSGPMLAFRSIVQRVMSVGTLKDVRSRVEGRMSAVRGRRFKVRGPRWLTSDT